MPDAPRYRERVLPAGVIVPEGPLLLRRLGRRFELVHIGQGARLELDGALADDLAAFVAGAPASPRLTGLATLEPALADLLSAERRLTWTPREALELGGFDTLFLELLGTCNERCLHCYADSSPEVKARLDEATCKDVVRQAAELGFRRVQLTGGEPLLCDFLPGLVALAREVGLWPEIYTNGLALRDELLSRLAPHQPGFAFSFYSHDPVVHDAVTRTPGSQARTLAAIRRAAAAGMPVRVSIIAMEENAAGLDQTLALFADLAVDVGISSSHAVGRGQRYAGKTDGTAAAPRATHRAPAAEPESPAGEALRLGTLCVTYAGDVVPCIFSRDLVLGRVPAQRLADIVAAPRSPTAAAASPELLARCRERLQCRDCQATAVALLLGAPS